MVLPSLETSVVPLSVQPLRLVPVSARTSERKRKPLPVVQITATAWLSSTTLPTTTLPSPLVLNAETALAPPGNEHPPTTTLPSWLTERASPAVQPGSRGRATIPVLAVQRVGNAVEPPTG